MKGLLLSLEGIDFTWKTPFTQWLARDLAPIREVSTTRDPPYMLSPWGSLKNFFETGEKIFRVSEVLLLLAARLDNFERFIKPALQEGHLVISDRYLDSWFAYQSVRLSDHFESSQNALLFLFSLNQAMLDRQFLALPDLTILISDDPEVTTQRKNQEKEISKYDQLELQKEVDKLYQELHNESPERIVVVDVRGKDIIAAYAVIKRVVDGWLKRKSKNLSSVYPDIGSIEVKDRLMAVKPLSWTVDEFDDYPLIVGSGDECTVTQVLYDLGMIQVEWDKDDFRQLPKHLNLVSQEQFSCVTL